MYTKYHAEIKHVRKRTTVKRTEVSRNALVNTGHHFKNGSQDSPFLQHAEDTDHTPVWSAARVLLSGIPTKRMRLFLESAIIRANPNLNSSKRQIGDFNLSNIAAQIVEGSSTRDAML